MNSVVAIDIETTGLDSERDAIIEIGAVRFRGNRTEREWSSLVNPRRHVPEFITNLTGIDDAMLRQAPTIRDVASDVQAFVNDAHVLGHNVGFDLGFLRKHIAFPPTQAIDTYELASVLLPSADRYNLGALGKELGILLPATHRALDDAKLTHAVYIRLVELAKGLPRDLLQELVRLSEPLGWGATHVFQEVLRRRSLETTAPPRPRKEKAAQLDLAPRGALETPERPRPLNIDETAALLEHGGTFSKHFGAYEHRPEQVQMLRAVAEALSQGRHLMVEAGTGVGKSFAYLIPSALFALQNNTRVVISTNTINLQDQLVGKDIPDLVAALGVDVRAAVLKGRANYLCPRRLENMRRFGPRNADEMRVLAKVLVWRRADSRGDRGSINLNGNTEREIWERLSAEDDACTTETCIERMGGACPFHKAKSAAQSAHLLIVNHALLLADVAAEGKVLPDYSYLVVDEGHHLEAATTNALSFRSTRFDLERMLKELGGSNAGMLGTLLTTCKRSLSASDFALMKQRVSRATDLAFGLEQLSREFFNALAAFAASQREEAQPTSYAWQARILPATRTLPNWATVEIAWDSASHDLALLLQAISEIHTLASGFYSTGLDDLEDVVGDLASAYRRLTDAQVSISAIVSKPSADDVYWIETRPPGNDPSLNAAPLSIGPLVEKVLWHEKSSVILTSATLTAHGEFQYLRTTLGADEADELQLGSPFDYEASTLLYVANDMPEPNAHEYQQTLSQAIISTAKATSGRLLALFTSYATLKKVSQATTAPLARENIFVYEQGEGASPNMLLESFKSSDRAVLLGTRSFWEGVDVPGTALSVLFITKLPFDVPTDPLIAARSEMYEDPFQEYYLPEAILKFRQGFGRLIRTASDRGVVAILDRRVLTKQYGRLFLESLPRCTSRQGPVASIAREASRWLG
jgi:DNA polymerase-3 subunit epsilon/ATP-dependent DNA helicase DinG